MSKIGRYGISKELEYKINKEYDELFLNDKAKLGFKASPTSSLNVYANEIIAKMTDLGIEMERKAWNAAIEAAAKCVDQANRDGPYNAIVSATEIRKLKK